MEKIKDTEHIWPTFQGSISQVLRRAGRVKYKEQLVVQDLKRVMQVVSGDVLWSVELWTYMGGVARVSYQKFAELVKACLHVPESAMFAFVNDRPIEDAMEELKEKMGDVFQPSTKVFLRYFDEIGDIPLKISATINKRETASVTDPEPVPMPLTEMDKKALLASVDLCRLVKIAPVDWSLILKSTGLDKKGYTVDTLEQQFFSLAEFHGVFNVVDYEVLLKEKLGESGPSQRQLIHCASDTKLSTWSWVKVLLAAPDLQRLKNMPPIVWTNFLRRLDIYTNMRGTKIVESFFANLVPRIRDDVFGLAGKSANLFLEIHSGERNSMITLFHSMKSRLASRAEILRTIEDLQEQKILSTIETRNRWARQFVYRLFFKDHLYFATTLERWSTYKSGIVLLTGLRFKTCHRNTILIPRRM